MRDENEDVGRFFKLYLQNVGGYRRRLPGERPALPLPRSLHATRSLPAPTSTDEFYRTIVDSMREGIMLVVDGAIVCANEALRQTFRVDGNSLEGTPVADLFPGGYGRIVGARMEESLSGAPVHADVVLRGPDGEGVYLDLCFTSIIFKDEVSILISVRDQSDRRNVEHALMETEKRYFDLFESAADAIVVTTDAGEIMSANGAFARFTEIAARDDLIGESLASYMAPGYLNVCDDLLYQRDITPRAGLRFETSVTSTAGRETPVEVNLSPLSGGFVQAVMRDISERKRADEAVHMLRRSQKLESIGELAGGIAHDFNNILHTILGFAHMIQKRDLLSGKEKDFLSYIISGGRRGADLVSRLLTFSRQNETEKHPLRIDEAVMETVRMLMSTLPSTITSQVAVKTDRYVYGNATQIGQIVTNLIINAMQAMPRGGNLRITLTECDGAQRRCRRAGVCVGAPCATLVVEDTGAGIPVGHREKVFDPFFTTKPVGEGTGLGLSVIHGIVRDMGGYIDFTSEEGIGTAFHVSLPLLAEGDTRTRGPIRRQCSLPIGTGTILFVDDEELACLVAKESLQCLGYRVAAYTDSLEALEIFSANPDAFDVAVLDLTMPYLTGVELAGKIKEVRPRLPVIVCTGYRRELPEATLKDAGIDRVLLKPVLAEEISHTIRELT
jgi:PAS domain S-box-containing protein